MDDIFKAINGQSKDIIQKLTVKFHNEVEFGFYKEMAEIFRSIKDTEQKFKDIQAKQPASAAVPDLPVSSNDRT